MWGLKEEKLRQLTQSLSNHVSYMEKKKDLCSIRHKMHVCSLKWLSHVNVMKIMLSICSIFRELISQSYSQQHSVPKNSSTQLSSYAASQPRSRAATFAEGFGHTRGSNVKAGKGLVPFIKQISLSNKPTPLHSASWCQAMIQPTPLLPW